MIHLEGKTALITGGSRGIGRAACRLLARCGANVALGYRLRQKDAEALVEEIARTGRRALAVQGDLSRRKDADTLVSRTLQAFGRVDILVNNHGIWKDGPIDTLSEEEW